MGVKSGSQLLLDALVSSLLRMYSKQQVYINNSGMLSPLFFLPPRFRSILIHLSFFFPFSTLHGFPFLGCFVFYPPLLMVFHSLLPRFSYSLNLTLSLFQLKAHKLQQTPFPCVINSPGLSSSNDRLIFRPNEFPPHYSAMPSCYYTCSLWEKELILDSLITIV